MDIRIGIVQSMKEIDVELPSDADRDKIMKDVEAAQGGDTVLWLTDRKGRRVGVPPTSSSGRRRASGSWDLAPRSHS
jgi:hypothetical protein